MIINFCILFEKIKKTEIKYICPKLKWCKDQNYIKRQLHHFIITLEKDKKNEPKIACL